MKRNILFLQILMFLFATFCYAQESGVPHGIDLSNAIFEQCKQNGTKPETQNLVSNIKNNFPYNISVSFPATISSDDTRENLRTTLLFIISQEDAYKKPEILTNLLIKLSAEERDFDIKIILTFGDEQILSKNNQIFGTIAYLNSIDDQTKYAAILLSVDSEKTNILAGTDGEVAPTWFVKNAYSAYKKNTLLKGYDKHYISFVYKLNLLHEPIQNAYLKAGIPCIKLSFSKGVSDSIISETLLEIADSYDYRETYKSDFHSSMYSFFSKQIWMTEETTIKSILISIFVTLLIIFTYGFINESFKFIAWNRIRKIWHYPFTIYLLALLVFISSKHFLEFLKSIFSIPISLYTIFVFALPITFISISIYFLFAIRHSHNFKKKSIDYLVLITGIVNMFVFCLIDISLFPIFAIEFLLALLATMIKKNQVHFLILGAYTVPFFPFLLQVMNNTNLMLLRENLISNIYFSLALILVVLPQYLTCFRLFAGFNFYWYTKRKSEFNRDYYNIACILSFTFIFVIILMIILPKSFREIKNKNIEKKIIITKNDEQSLNVKTSKHFIFGDAIRTVRIDSKKQILQCDLRIRGKNNVPVLFSDYDYVAESSTEISFLIPYEPPSKMEFSYGESGLHNEIILTVIYTDFSMERVEIKE